MGGVSKMMKYKRGQLSDEEALAIAQKLRENAEGSIAVDQGKYEKEVGNVVNPTKTEGLHDQLDKLVNKAFDAPTGENEENPEETFNLRAVDVIQEMAETENRIYEKILKQKLAEKGKGSMDELNGQERVDVEAETQKEMDEKVRKIGLDFMRGEMAGNNFIGNFFKNKGAKELSRCAENSKE